MTRRQITNPTPEDYAEAEAAVERVAIDVSANMRLRLGPDNGETHTHLMIEGTGDGYYMEVEDATLLLRFDDGTPFMRFAVVNGFLTEEWVLADEAELQARLDAFVQGLRDLLIEEEGDDADEGE